MAFPGGTKNGRDQFKEAGGQPLPLGAVSDGQTLRRTGINLVGISPVLFGPDANPNTIVTGYIGQLYKDTVGGSTWVKQTGENTNTGWIAF